ncbi:hypothetical protein [Microbulbifer sp. GL-2]|uniref:hypothetical protein n=1 Tax=Microbulbifer sp. GL-2 TaxID=2591606 RepID=UPI00155A8441|nr:hypothetical protein [Microbulbifer sp. GL-2]
MYGFSFGIDIAKLLTAAKRRLKNVVIERNLCFLSAFMKSSSILIIILFSKFCPGNFVASQLTMKHDNSSGFSFIAKWPKSSTAKARRSLIWSFSSAVNPRVLIWVLGGPKIKVWNIQLPMQIGFLKLVPDHIHSPIPVYSDLKLSSPENVSIGFQYILWDKESTLFLGVGHHSGQIQFSLRCIFS